MLYEYLNPDTMSGEEVRLKLISVREERSSRQRTTGIVNFLEKRALEEDTIACDERSKFEHGDPREEEIA